MFYFRRFFVLLISGVFLAITPQQGLAELRIVTTTTDLADFAQTIGGDRVQVDSICSGVQDPHFVQARPSYMVKLSRADLLLSVGLDLEIGWLPALIAGARNPAVNPGNPGYLDTSSAIVPLDVHSGHVDRSHGDLHPHGNPHFWLDPENAKAIARLITERMASLSPEDAAFFRENLQLFEQRIDQAMVEWSRIMEPYQGTRVVSYHRTFNYFYQRFGLIGDHYVEERPGIPPSPAHLAELIRNVQSNEIPVIFHENYYPRATSDLVGERTSATVLMLPTSVGGSADATDYEALIGTIINTFVETMGPDS